MKVSYFNKIVKDPSSEMIVKKRGLKEQVYFPSFEFEGRHLIEGYQVDFENESMKFIRDEIKEKKDLDGVLIFGKKIKDRETAINYLYLLNEIGYLYSPDELSRDICYEGSKKPNRSQLREMDEAMDRVWRFIPDPHEIILWFVYKG